MKIIHTSNLRLDSIMDSRYSLERAEERKKELLDAFTRMVEYASNNQVEVILITGGLFQTNTPSYHVEQLVFSIMESHPQIQFLCLHSSQNGSYSPRVKTPSNYKTFSKNTITTYSFQNVTISGSESCNSYSDLKLSPASVNILCLYGPLTESIINPNGIYLPFYSNQNIDYLALGSIHDYKYGKLDQRGTWCYPGTLEALQFGENGEKGFVLLDTENQKVSYAFIPFSQRVFHDIFIDVTHIFTKETLESNIENALKSIPSKDAVRIVLRGYYNPEMNPSIQQLQNLYKDPYFLFQVKEEAHLSLHKDDYSHDVSLKGEFLRQVQNTGFQDSLKNRIILCGLAALQGEELPE